jgi:hypothetical protein
MDSSVKPLTGSPIHADKKKIDDWMQNHDENTSKTKTYVQMRPHWIASCMLYTGLTEEEVVAFGFVSTYDKLIEADASAVLDPVIAAINSGTADNVGSLVQTIINGITSQTAAKAFLKAIPQLQKLTETVAIPTCLRLIINTLVCTNPKFTMLSQVKTEGKLDDTYIDILKSHSSIGPFLTQTVPKVIDLLHHLMIYTKPGYKGPLKKDKFSFADLNKMRNSEEEDIKEAKKYFNDTLAKCDAHKLETTFRLPVTPSNFEAVIAAIKLLNKDAKAEKVPKVKNNKPKSDTPKTPQTSQKDVEQVIVREKKNTKPASDDDDDDDDEEGEEDDETEDDNKTPAPAAAPAAKATTKATAPAAAAEPTGKPAATTKVKVADTKVNANNKRERDDNATDDKQPTYKVAQRKLPPPPPK